MSTPEGPLTIDLGKHKRSRVRKLERGTGPLVQKVARSVEDLASSGTVGPNVQPIIVIVEREAPVERMIKKLLP